MVWLVNTSGLRLTLYIGKSGQLFGPYVLAMMCSRTIATWSVPV